MGKDKTCEAGSELSKVSLGHQSYSVCCKKGEEAYIDGFILAKDLSPDDLDALLKQEKKKQPELDLQIIKKEISTELLSILWMQIKNLKAISLKDLNKNPEKFIKCSPIGNKVFRNWTAFNHGGFYSISCKIGDHPYFHNDGKGKFSLKCCRKPQVVKHETYLHLVEEPLDCKCSFSPYKLEDGSIGCCKKGETPYQVNKDGTQKCCPKGELPHTISKDGTQKCCKKGETPYQVNKEGLQACCPAGQKATKDSCSSCPEGVPLLEYNDGTKVCCPRGSPNYQANSDGTKKCCGLGEKIYNKENGAYGCCSATNYSYNKGGGATGCCPDKATSYKINEDGTEGCCPQGFKVKNGKSSKDPQTCCKTYKDLSTAVGYVEKDGPKAGVSEYLLFSTTKPVKTSLEDAEKNGFIEYSESCCPIDKHVIYETIKHKKLDAGLCCPKDHKYIWGKLGNYRCQF